MEFVRQLLQHKDPDVWSVTPDTRVYNALKLMAEKNIGALLVMDTGQLVGIFSERDYARKVILKGKSSKNIPVTEIMSERVVAIRPNQTVDECMALMTDKRIRHLPVVERNKVVGVISIGDVVSAVISDKEFEIKQLENYITGSQ